MPDILTHTEAGITTITLNRVDKKNSITSGSARRSGRSAWPRFDAGGGVITRFERARSKASSARALTRHLGRPPRRAAWFTAASSPARIHPSTLLIRRPRARAICGGVNHSPTAHPRAVRVRTVLVVQRPGRCSARLDNALAPVARGRLHAPAGRCRFRRGALTGRRLRQPRKERAQRRAGRALGPADLHDLQPHAPQTPGRPAEQRAGVRRTPPATARQRPRRRHILRNDLYRGRWGHSGFRDRCRGGGRGGERRRQRLDRVLNLLNFAYDRF